MGNEAAVLSAGPHGVLDSIFRKPAGTVNASALTVLVDTETSCDDTVINATSPGGKGAAAAVAGGAAGESAGSFFF